MEFLYKDDGKGLSKKYLDNPCLYISYFFEKNRDLYYQKLNDVMQQLAHKYQVTKPAIAIAWLLRHPAHMQPIVGTTSSQHLKETIKACDFTLTRQEWYDLYLASEKPLP